MSTRSVAELVTQVLQLESCEELCFTLTTLRTTTRGQGSLVRLATAVLVVCHVPRLAQSGVETRLLGKSLFTEAYTSHPIPVIP